jgi:hypothetical protein
MKTSLVMEAVMETNQEEVSVTDFESNPGGKEPVADHQ